MVAHLPHRVHCWFSWLACERNQSGQLRPTPFRFALLQELVCSILQICWLEITQRARRKTGTHGWSGRCRIGPINILTYDLQELRKPFLDRGVIVQMWSKGIVSE
jgi:hypothetical protein